MRLRLRLRLGLGGRRPGAAERAPRHCMCEEDGALLGRHGLALPLPLVRQRTVRAAAGDATGHRGVLERGRLDATAVEAEVCAKALRRTEPHPLRRMVDHERVAHLLHRRVLARSVEEGAVERHFERGRRFGMFGDDDDDEMTSGAEAGDRRAMALDCDVLA